MTKGDAEGGGRDDSVRAVSRALLLLRTLNGQGDATLHQLYQRTGLAKATLSRLLKTLAAEGYVRPDGHAGRYRLTARVRDLADGYTERARVVDVGAPLALALTRRIRWPLAIGTLDGDAVVVRHSTMPYSPLAVHATTLGHRLGLLDTAMGRVYLAHADAAQQQVLRELLRAAAPEGLPGGERRLDAELRLVRRHGYALRLPNDRRASATLAVPVLQQGAAVAALGMTTFGRAMTPRTIEQHLPLLQQTAQAMAEACGAAG